MLQTAEKKSSMGDTLQANKVEVFEQGLEAAMKRKEGLTLPIGKKGNVFLQHPFTKNYKAGPALVTLYPGGLVLRIGSDELRMYNKVMIGNFLAWCEGEEPTIKGKQPNAVSFDIY